LNVNNWITFSLVYVLQTPGSCTILIGMHSILTDSTMDSHPGCTSGRGSVQRPTAEAQRVQNHHLHRLSTTHFTPYRANLFIDDLGQLDFPADLGHNAQMIHPLCFKSLSFFHPPKLTQYSQNPLLTGAEYRLNQNCARWFRHLNSRKACPESVEGIPGRCAFGAVYEQESTAAYSTTDY